MSALAARRVDSADGPAPEAPPEPDDATALEPEPADGRPHADAEPEPEPPSPEPTSVDTAVQVEPDPPPGDLRSDFGAHFESNYQRLVAQLYAITLDAGLAHDAVQDAYARAWRRWATVGRTTDPTAWVRGVAVRSTIRSWRSVLARFGVGRPRPEPDDIEPRTRAMLSALRRLPPAERRALVLSYMASSTVEEIAAIEQVSMNAVQARLSRGRRLITENLVDDLPALLGPPARPADPGGRYE